MKSGPLAAMVLLTLAGGGLLAWLATADDDAGPPAASREPAAPFRSDDVPASGAEDDVQFLSTAFGPELATRPVRSEGARRPPARLRPPLAGAGGSREELLAALQTGTDERLLAQRVFELAGSQRLDAEVVEVLAGLYERTATPSLKARIVAALAVAEVPEGAAAVEVAARHDPEPSVRTAALEALVGSLSGGASPLLAEVLDRDPEPPVRERAAVLLGLVAAGRPETLAALQRSALADPSPAVRQAALEGLAVAPGPEALEALALLAETAASPADQRLAESLRAEVARMLADDGKLLETFTEEER